MPVAEPPSAELEEAAKVVASRIWAVLAGEATFAEWVEWFVLIESDARGTRGAIPFALHDYQHERAVAWEAGDSEVILKARQLGFSWLAAAYAFWTAAYHPSAHVSVMSAGRTEMRKFMRRVRFIWRRLPEPLKGGAIVAMETIAFANESMISGFPSTEDAGIGETNKLVIFDEWAMHPYGAANLSAALPTVAESGQVLIMSTSSHTLGQSGHFWETWQRLAAPDSASEDDEALPLDDIGLHPVFVPWNARPGRDERWWKSQRQRYITMSDDAFRAWYPETPEDAFQGREGLVYPTAGPHLCKPAAVPWEACTLRFYASDYGGGDPSAIITAGVYRTTKGPRLHVYGCLYHPRGQALTVDAVAEWLLIWHKQGAFTRGADDPAPGGETIAETLRAVHGLPAKRADNKRYEGLELVRDWIGRTVEDAEGQPVPDPWITFEPGAVWDGFWREFTSYRNKQSTDPHSREKYDTDTPVDHHGDRLDALRYLLMAAYLEMLNDRPKVAFKEARW